MVDTTDTPMPPVTDARHFGKRSADAEPEADADAAVYNGGYYGHPGYYGYGSRYYGYGSRYYGYGGYPYGRFGYRWQIFSKSIQAIPKLHSSSNQKMFFSIRIQKLLTIFMLKSI